MKILILGGRLIMEMNPMFRVFAPAMDLMT